MTTHELIERLNRRAEWKELGSNFLETGFVNELLVNPDGPEAAQALSTLTDEVARLREELGLWLMLVNEGGVPRYTVTPGAALNTVVTSTKRLVARTSMEGQPHEGEKR